MAWNGPINGDYSTVDFTRAPWAAGIMTLTHEETMHAKTTCEQIESEYVPGPDNYYQPVSDTYVVPEYNKRDWERGINGDTYAVIKQYDAAVNTQGINESGIIPEPVEEAPAEPTEEAPAEEAPANEPETALEG